MRQFLPVRFGVILSIAVVGCISSEESGSEKQAPVTQQESPPAQQAAKQPDAQTGQSQKKQPRQRGSSLTSKQDTLVASVTRKSKSSSRPRVGRPKDPSYTVQVGVFRKAQNALRYQKLAKKRFPKNSVHNRYDSKTKMYWVSIGKFTTKEEAVALRREIMKKHPKDYEKAWVNYIPR